MSSDYYVYVYIDPRNFEEFYFGKGTGARKDAHLQDHSDTQKAHRIEAIRKAGLEPTIRIIARDLSEHDALLVEKTLLWKLGKNLTNISSGHYKDNFRPHDTLYKKLSGFDYQRGFYYYNVGEGGNRCWSDYVKFGFISAGHGAHWRNAMQAFNTGDLIAAYLKGRGFVGIGTVTSEAMPVSDAVIDGKQLLSLDLQQPGLGQDSLSSELCEYVALVKWHRTVEAKKAKWSPKSGLYTTTHIRASLDCQPKTIRYLEKEFEFKVSDYLENS
jgi:hypothetical protein